MGKNKNILRGMIGIVALLLCMRLTGLIIAHAEETDVPLVIGETYTYTDNSGEYSMEVVSETDYHMRVRNGTHELSYTGRYTYSEGKLTVYVLDEIQGVYTISGTALVKVSEQTVVENPTFLGRIQTWLEENYVELATTVGDIVLVAVFLFNFLKNKKELAGLTKGVSFTRTAQTDVIDATNGLIGAYNRLESEFKEYKETESVNYATVGAMVVQTKAILDILTTVYANSKNLPQGVKDLVNLKYADVLKKERDTETLKEIVNEIQESPTENTAED